MEDMGDLPSLKSWLQATSSTEQITSIGQTLGSYLAHIHNETAGDASLLEDFSSNLVGRNLSSSLYFGGLPAAAAKHGYTDPFIATAAKAAEAEVLAANEVWTLGDFWTGNVLFSTPDDQSVPGLTVLDLELAKPGTAAFDIGQMGAEMYCLAKFRHPEQGHILLQEFFGAYRAARKTSVDAAGVAIRIAAHLFTMMPRAWTAEAGEEKVKAALQQGFELLKMGWERDEAALKNSIVGALME
jgi:aminoglycoside phosphotransferase (APT) family kinase protein